MIERSASVLIDEKIRSPSTDEREEVTVTAHIPDPVRTAVVDVVSLRGLARAVGVLRGGPNENALNDAIARLINVNGTIAKAIEGDKR